MSERPVLQQLGAWAVRTGYTGTRSVDEASGPRPELLLATGDHAVAAPSSGVDSPVSALPWGHAHAETDRINAGVSPLCALAARHGVDISVTGFPDSSGGSPSQWLDAGREAADARADAAVPLLLTGTVGTGATTTAAALVGVLCNVEPVKVVGRGGGPAPVSDEKWKHKTVAIRDRMFQARAHRRRPVDASAVLDILDILGTPDTAFTVGLLAQSATRRTPVILDGVSGLAAGLLADALVPGAAHWLLLPEISSEPAASVAARRLALTPVIDRPLGAPAAAAGLVVLPLLDAAVSLRQE
ncbi:nicotinate-nucleotide--dimethylbenzimidazole phosphoribosyltransferase [Corynebacterium sp.]|uniref:nicotinate-nucleotide--dimethylbenzimidazole phosphoribosyltransferase n=1 Tax=Corynebacterium sp. TaxID=1720 RepID=UPI0028A97F14|nr:nicotinate-nucleotide--dimethylbenzimidazole phosphoribosyltransferase [Corynebacterium sp.]